MQYSLRATMLAILFVAIWLAAPRAISVLVGFTVWMLLPGLLVAWIWPVDDGRQVFARGSLAAYCAITLEDTDSGYLVRSLLGASWSPLLRVVLVLLVGGCCVYLARRFPLMTDRSSNARTSPQSNRDSAP